MKLLNCYMKAWIKNNMNIWIKNPNIFDIKLM